MMEMFMSELTGEILLIIFFICFWMIVILTPFMIIGKIVEVIWQIKRKSK